MNSSYAFYKVINDLSIRSASAAAVLFSNATEANDQHFI